MAQATLFLDLDGTELSAEESALLTRPHIGGVILFGRNTQTAKQVAELIQAIRGIRPDLVISIDQEGGRVQRLKNGVTILPPVNVLSQVYSLDKAKGLSAARQMGYLMAAEMRLLDIDLSFAPVLDVNYDRNTVIGDRAFANDHLTVCALSAEYIEGMRDAGMSATAKHFPGHGWADADTHHNDAIDERTFEQLWNTDMLPFREAICNGVEGMMFAHVLYPNCASDPAGYSDYWMKEVLRERLAFTGFVFSDDLSMKAAQAAGGYKQRAEKAIAAGCQVLLCCNDRSGTIEVLNYLESLGCEDTLDLGELKGSAWQVDNTRLSEARLLVKELMD